jgi:hypothetical protein
MKLESYWIICGTVAGDSLEVQRLLFLPFVSNKFSLSSCISFIKPYFFFLPFNPVALLSLCFLLNHQHRQFQYCSFCSRQLHRQYHLVSVSAASVVPVAPSIPVIQFLLLSSSTELHRQYRLFQCLFYSSSTVYSVTIPVSPFLLQWYRLFQFSFAPVVPVAPSIPFDQCAPLLQHHLLHRLICSSILLFTPVAPVVPVSPSFQ